LNTNWRIAASRMSTSSATSTALVPHLTAWLRWWVARA
jgi:hypothetical protein